MSEEAVKTTENNGTDAYLFVVDFLFELFPKPKKLNKLYDKLLPHSDDNAVLALLERMDEKLDQLEQTKKREKQLKEKAKEQKKKGKELRRKLKGEFKKRKKEK